MSKKIKQLTLITTILIAGVSTAYAGCEWTHGSLGQTIETTSDRLKLYSECKQGCESLAVELNNTTTMMNTASECDASVLTAKNKQMVAFFDSRFKLIRKLKTGQRITAAPTVAKPVPLDPRATKMTISSQAYQELWVENNRAPTIQRQVNPQQQQVAHQNAVKRQQAAKAKEIQIAQQNRLNRQRQLAHENQVKQQKLAQVRLQNQRHAEARKRKILLLQHQERIRLQQLQHERARVKHLADQKARLQRLARLQQ